MKKSFDFLRIIFLLVLIFGIAYFYLYVFNPLAIPPTLRIGMLMKPATILILGTDNIIEAETGKIINAFGHSDTIILCRFYPTRSQITLVSIPRDTQIFLESGWSQKINAAYPIGGIDLLKNVIEKLTYSKIDKYIIVNTKALEEIIDILGGVEVEVDKDMYYVDKRGNLFINLKQGWQTLNGKEAHGFVRFRRDIMGDLTRVQRQQHLMSQMLKKIQTPASFLKIHRLFWAIQKNTKTDLSLKALAFTLNSLRTIKTEKIQTLTLPGKTADLPDAFGYFYPNQEEIANLFKKL